MRNPKWNLHLTPSGAYIAQATGARHQLDYLQKAVQGDVEVVYTNVGSIRYAMWCNELAKLRDVPFNHDASVLVERYLQPGDYIAGPVLVTIPNNGDTRALTLEELNTVTAELGYGTLQVSPEVELHRLKRLETPDSYVPKRLDQLANELNVSERSLWDIIDRDRSGTPYWSRYPYSSHDDDRTNPLTHEGQLALTKALTTNDAGRNTRRPLSEINRSTNPTRHGRSI